MKLPFDLRALWESALRWYRGHSPRDQRIILGVVIASGLSLVYIAVVEPVLDYRKGVAQEIADGQEELERSLRFLAAKDTLRAERDELRKKLAQAKTRLLPGGTGTLGAAALQERTNAIATDKGITPQSTQVMKEEAVDPYRKVSVRLTLSGELKAFAELVSGLEYGQQLTVPFVEISRRGAVAGAKGPRTLSVTMEVSGFVQGGGKTEASEAEQAAAEVAPAEGGAAGPPAEPVAEAAAGGETPPSTAAASTTTTAVASSSTSSSTIAAPPSTAPPTPLPRPGGGVTTTPRAVPTTLPPYPGATPPPAPAPLTHQGPPAAGRTAPVPPPSGPIILGAPPTLPPGMVPPEVPPVNGIPPGAAQGAPGMPPAAGVPPVLDAPPVVVEPQVLGRPTPPPPGGDEEYEEDPDE